MQDNTMPKNPNPKVEEKNENLPENLSNSVSPTATGEPLKYISLTQSKLNRIIDKINGVAPGSKETILDLSDEGCVQAVTQAIQGKSAIDLQGVCIGNDGAKALAKALESNTTVASINLERNDIATAGAKALAIALEKNKTITSINLSHNEIRDDGIEALAKALESNTTVTSINLEDNCIGENGVKAFDAVAKIKDRSISILFDEAALKYYKDSQQESQEKKSEKPEVVPAPAAAGLRTQGMFAHSPSVQPGSPASQSTASANEEEEEEKASPRMSG